MKKILTALAAALLCALLAGCAEISVDCGISESHTAYIKIGLTADLSGLDDGSAREAAGRLRQLGDYYRDTLGFTVESTERDEEPIQLLMTLEKQAESYPAAFEELRKMACDANMSPFTKVTLLSRDGESEQGYIAELTLNADKIWETAGTEDFPKALREKLEAELAECSGCLSLTLPSTSVEEYNGTVEEANGFATAAADISFDDATVLKLSTRAVLEEGKIIPAGAEMPEARLNKESGRLKILCLIAAGIFAVSLIVLVVSLVRRKKPPTL